MDWANLFSDRRLGDARRNRDQPYSEQRGEFQRDFDRVVFSSAFRRLQSKTQVVPLPGNDFVHTRLTHSLEVSCVGRSLGRLVGNRLIAEDPTTFRELGITAADFESVVAAACLAHDIGNPPFGHSGEDAISEYFCSNRASSFIEDLSQPQIADLQNFEGNAAGFRLLTHTSQSQSKMSGGLGITFATLGAFSKYPKQSLPKRKTNKVSEKKFGFFQSEKENFEKVAAGLGLIEKEIDDMKAWCRHPLTFLVEAADDICYSVIDLEDGFKCGRVPFKKTEELLVGILGPDFSIAESAYRLLLGERDKIGYLRAKAINELTWQSVDAAVEKMPDMLAASFDKSITSLLPGKAALEEITTVSVGEIYRAQDIIEIESAGFEVLAGLLDAFLNAIFTSESRHYQMLRHLIPDKFLAENRRSFDDPYTSIMNIVELVAGMTDTFAIETYRKIKGISLPRY